MNPHFLYNVLSVVNALAIAGQSDKIRDVCGNLSGMLRYSSSYETGTASVRDEIRFTRAYLDLMQSRYDGVFEYAINVDPALWNVALPKLVIQPLCENAFTHSFAKTEPPYRLSIDVARVADGFCISVADNGCGFPPEARESVMARANEAGYGDLSRLQLGGLGIVSSVIRMRLLMKQDVHCDIAGSREGGAVVAIHVRDAAGLPGEGEGAE